MIIYRVGILSSKQGKYKEMFLYMTYIMREFPHCCEIREKEKEFNRQEEKKGIRYPSGIGSNLLVRV